MNLGAVRPHTCDVSVLFVKLLFPDSLCKQGHTATPSGRSCVRVNQHGSHRKGAQRSLVSLTHQLVSVLFFLLPLL